MTRLLFITLLMNTTILAFGQKDSLPPYLQFRTLPPFKLLKSDSSGWITKADLQKHKRTIIMLFSPDCEHCQKQTEILMEHLDELKDVQIVMATTLPLEKIKEFIRRFKLNDHPNFFIGRDNAMFLGIYFDLHSIPLLAIYNKKDELINVFEGGAKWKKLAEALK